MAGAFDIAWAIIKAGPKDPDPYDPFARQPSTMGMSQGPPRQQRRGSRRPAQERRGYRTREEMPLTDTSAERMQRE